MNTNKNTNITSNTEETVSQSSPRHIPCQPSCEVKLARLGITLVNFGDASSRSQSNPNPIPFPKRLDVVYPNPNTNPNPNHKREEKEHKESGKFGCTVRHVAPYWIRVQLCLSRHKYHNRTIAQALDAVKTKFPDRHWWRSRLCKGELSVHVDHEDHEKYNSSTRATQRQCETILDLVITNRDVTLSGYYHMHEDAVPFDNGNSEPTIIYQNDQFIIVNKPAGIDVLSNPGAGRIFQSLPGRLLYHENTVKDILPAHRIDNPVSGIVCCGKTIKGFKTLMRCIQLRKAHKTYLAKVHVTNEQLWLQLQNNLPWIINIPLGFDNASNKAIVDETTTGKHCQTTICEIWKDTYTASPPPNHCRHHHHHHHHHHHQQQQQQHHPQISDIGTVVLVIQLATGRKHQIRQHLACVGLPIVGDKKYADFSDSDRQQDNHTPDDYSLRYYSGVPIFDPRHSRLREFYEQYFDTQCDRCRFVKHSFENHSQNENNNRTISFTSQHICLHAWKYEFPTLDKSFVAPIPTWVTTVEK